MRTKRWSARESDLEHQESVCDRRKSRILRSSASPKKLPNIDQSTVVNLSTLIDALEKCASCSKGPLELPNISQDVRMEGPCPILTKRCSHCSSENQIRTSECHQTGKRGPPTFDLNSRAGIATLHSGIGHTHYAAVLGTMGLPSLSKSNYRKRERGAG